MSLNVICAYSFSRIFEYSSNFHNFIITHKARFTELFITFVCYSVGVIFPIVKYTDKDPVAIWYAENKFPIADEDWNPEYDVEFLRNGFRGIGRPRVYILLAHEFISTFYSILFYSFINIVFISFSQFIIIFFLFFFVQWIGDKFLRCNSRIK